MRGRAAQVDAVHGRGVAEPPVPHIWRQDLALEDVAAAVINTNFAGEAGLVPARDALVLEDSESPYANIVVVREADKASPKTKALMKAVQSPEVKAYIEKELVGKGIMPSF